MLFSSALSLFFQVYPYFFYQNYRVSKHEKQSPPPEKKDLNFILNCGSLFLEKDGD